MWSWKSAETSTAALKEYNKVIELRPELPEAYSNLAVALKEKR